MKRTETKIMMPYHDINHAAAKMMWQTVVSTCKEQLSKCTSSASAAEELTRWQSASDWRAMRLSQSDQ